MVAFTNFSLPLKVKKYNNDWPYDTLLMDMVVSTQWFLLYQSSCNGKIDLIFIAGDVLMETLICMEEIAFGINLSGMLDGQLTTSTSDNVCYICLSDWILMECLFNYSSASLEDTD